MSLSARFLTDVVRVDAGGEAVVALQVRNTSDIVEAYRFEAVGVPSSWMSFENESISLYPGTDAETKVRIAPPREPDVPAGQLPFGVKVVPLERASDGALPEALLDIAPFYESGAELIPRNSSARRTARHQLAVDNRGNGALSVEMKPHDPDDLLGFRVRPETLEVPPGSARFAKVRVRTRKLAWAGQPSSRPFTIDVLPTGVDPAAAPPMQLNGSMLQNPIFPSWTMRAVLASLAVVAGVIALWFGLLRPTIQSAAEDAVKAPVANALQNATKAENAAKTASQSEDAAGTAAGKAEDAAGKLDPEAVTGLSGAPAATRLTAEAAAGGTATDTLAIDEGRRLEITDIVLQNPQGDTGVLTLRRGDEVLLRSSLANFRDLDFHFVSPIRIDGGQSLSMDLTCTEAGEAGNGSCSVAALVGGVNRKLPQPS